MFIGWSSRYTGTPLGPIDDPCPKCKSTPRILFDVATQRKLYYVVPAGTTHQLRLVCPECEKEQRIVDPSRKKALIEEATARVGAPSSNGAPPSKIDPKLDAAWDRLISMDVAPFEQPAGVVILFSTTVGVLAKTVQAVSTERAQWARLDAGAYEGALRIAIGPNLLYWLGDAENHAHMTRLLDCRPSETVTRLWEIYLEHYVPQDRRSDIALLPGLFESDTAAAFAKCFRNMHEAAGLGDAGVTEMLEWATRAKGLVERVDNTYWTMLEQFAEESA